MRLRGYAARDTVMAARLIFGAQRFVEDEKPLAVVIWRNDEAHPGVTLRTVANGSNLRVTSEL